MLCSQVETLCGGINYWFCEYLSYWYFSTYSFLGFEQNFRQKMSSKFSAWWPSTNIFWLIIFLLIIASVSRPPWNPIYDSFRGYSLYLRSLFTQRIKTAAEKSQCVPYICMLLVWNNGVLQHQRPFGMVYWTASVFLDSWFTPLSRSSSWSLYQQLILSKWGPSSPNFAQRRGILSWSQRT